MLAVTSLFLIVLIGQQHLTSFFEKFSPFCTDLQISNQYHSRLISHPQKYTIKQGIPKNISIW